MRIPEKAITKLPDTPQSKKTQKYDRERARNCSDILQSKGERIAGKSGYSSKGIRGYENSDIRTETRKGSV